MQRSLRNWQRQFANRFKSLTKGKFEERPMGLPMGLFLSLKKGRNYICEGYVNVFFCVALR